MNTNFINIIQMISQNFRFRLVLILILLQITLSINHIGNCFGNCSTCETNNPSICKGVRPCQWGYYYNESNGNCQLLPSLKLASKELPQPSDNSNKLPIRNWGTQAKYSTCQSNIQGKKQTIDIIGIFFQIQSISRVLKITPGLDIYQLSFNLIRDQWLPFNDFLLIDIYSQQSLIQSIEISYQSRIKIDSQPTMITCQGKKFINEKFNIKIVNDGNVIGEDISLYFTSVLYNSRWGIANIKLLEGCNNYVRYNQKKQDCSVCQNGFYSVFVGNSVGSCQKCSLFCEKCQSKDTCVTCIKGAELSNGKCIFPGQYKLQWIDTKGQEINCNTRSFVLGNLGKNVVVPLVNNHQDELYDEVQIGFEIYYNLIHWNSGSQNGIKVKINQIEVFSLNYKDLTSKASDQCIYFKGNRVASISYLSKSLVHISNKLNLQFQLSSTENITFGIQNIFVKSIIKPERPALALDLPQPATNQDLRIPESEPTPASQSPIPKEDISVLANPIPKTPIIISSSPSLASEAAIIPPNSQAPKQSPVIDQKLSSNNEQFSQIQYLPIISSGQPGIQLSIQNIKQLSGNLYVLINKLPKQSVKVISSYIQDEVLHVFVSINQSFTEGILSVVDNITTSTSRLLQKNEIRILAKTFISRFDYISTSQADSISHFSTFYSVFAWLGVILIIPMVMLGFGVTVEEYIFTLQYLFLHLYICTDILPLSFRDVVAGLRIVENLNFFVPAHGKSIESQWIGNVVQNGPVRTSLYNTDINFTREIYPIIIVNVIFIGWFLIVFIAKKTLLRAYTGEKATWNIIVNNIADRIINYADQIWRYQFMSVVWLCFIQFQNFIYPSGSNRSETLNVVLCISCFICSILWPLITGFISRKQYYQTQYSDFIYKHQDIYYHRIPLFYLPTRHHRIGYPLLKIGKLFFIPFIIAYVGDNSITLVLLITIQLLEVIYAKNYDIYQDAKYFNLRVIQNSLFCLIQIIMLSLQTIKNSSSTSTFSFLGFLLSSLGVLIITASLTRIGLLSYKKYTQLSGIQFQQMCDQDLKKLKTQRVV